MREAGKRATLRLRLKLEGKALPVVLFIIFLDILGMGILMPVLPQLMYDIIVPAGYGEAAALIPLSRRRAPEPRGARSGSPAGDAAS